MAQYALELSYPSSNSQSSINRYSPKSKQISSENEHMTIDQTRTSIAPSTSMSKTSKSSHQLNSSLEDGSEVEEILSDEVCVSSSFGLGVNNSTSLIPKRRPHSSVTGVRQRHHARLELRHGNHGSDTKLKVGSSLSSSCKNFSQVDKEMKVMEMPIQTLDHANNRKRKHQANADDASNAHCHVGGDSSSLSSTIFPSVGAVDPLSHAASSNVVSMPPPPLLTPIDFSAKPVLDAIGKAIGAPIQFRSNKERVRPKLTARSMASSLVHPSSSLMSHEKSSGLESLASLPIISPMSSSSQSRPKIIQSSFPLKASTIDLAVVEEESEPYSTKEQPASKRHHCENEKAWPIINDLSHPVDDDEVDIYHRSKRRVLSRMSSPERAKYLKEDQIRTQRIRSSQPIRKYLHNQEKMKAQMKKHPNPPHPFNIPQRLENFPSSLQHVHSVQVIEIDDSSDESIDDTRELESDYLSTPSPSTQVQKHAFAQSHSSEQLPNVVSNRRHDTVPNHAANSNYVSRQHRPSISAEKFHSGSSPNCWRHLSSSVTPSGMGSSKAFNQISEAKRGSSVINASSMNKAQQRKLGQLVPIRKGQSSPIAPSASFPSNLAGPRDRSRGGKANRPTSFAHAISFPPSSLSSNGPYYAYHSASSAVISSSPSRRANVALRTTARVARKAKSN